MKDLTHDQIEQIKKNFPKGTRIQLLQMNDDPRPIESGTTGTVEHVDDMGTIHCNFDNGRFLGVIPFVDVFKKISEVNA